MKRTVLTVLVAIGMAGCAPMPESPCEGPSSRHVTIHYGDSELRVTPPVREVHRRGNFTLRLQPDSKESDLVDFEDVSVTVKGKTGADWITEKSEKHNESRTITYCVPADEPEEYQMYEVTVEGVGTLDPRVRIRD